MIIQEIGQSLDTPDDLVFELFNKACFDGHTLGQSILGTQQTVSALDQRDLAVYGQVLWQQPDDCLCCWPAET